MQYANGNIDLKVWFREINFYKSYQSGKKLNCLLISINERLLTKGWGSKAINVLYAYD